jgi:broad specificity phosphatase PhoE
LTARHLVLIRHSVVVIAPEKPANLWHLSVEGRARAKRLAQQVQPYQPNRIVTSIEPKAVETGEIVADTLQIPLAAAPNLHEHQRSRIQFRDRDWFENQVELFFTNPGQLIFGDETANEARRRFASAVDSLRLQYPSDNLAVVTHGTVLTLFVSPIANFEPFTFWKQLGLPAFVVLSLPEMQLIKVENDIE